MTITPASDAAMRMLNEKASELELIPEPRYTTVGEPAYRLEDLADNLGISQDDFRPRVEEPLALKQAAGHDSGLYANIRIVCEELNDDRPHHTARP